MTNTERAREIVNQFPVEEEFDAKQCLIAEISEALAAAERAGAEKMRERVALEFPGINAAIRALPLPGE